MFRYDKAKLEKLRNIMGIRIIRVVQVLLGANQLIKSMVLRGISLK